MPLSLLIWVMCSTIKGTPQPKYNRRRHRTWHEIRCIKAQSHKIGYSHYEFVFSLSNQPHSINLIHNLPSATRQWEKAFRHAITYGSSCWRT